MDISCHKPLRSTDIQNVANPQRNSRIGKAFELAEPRFHRDMERHFRIRMIFSYHDRNGNRDQNRILNSRHAYNE